MTNLFDHLLIRFRQDCPGNPHLDAFVKFCKEEMEKVPVTGLSPAVEGFGVRLSTGLCLSLATQSARTGDTQYAGAVSMNNPGMNVAGGSGDMQPSGAVGITQPK